MEMTTNEEKELLSRCGQENPFRTPDGYFDVLPQQVMDRIKQRRRRHIAWRWAVAAIMTGCIFTAGFTLMKPAGETLTAEETGYMEEELNYSMLNNIDIMYYLTEAE